MLKTTPLELGGKDAGSVITLRELPALVADRHARVLLKQIGADPAGGVVALAMQHMAAIRKLGPRALEPFCMAKAEPGHPLEMVKDWRNIDVVQQAALLLHVGFLVGREQIEVPVTMQAQQILNDTDGVAVTFCSPVIAAVLESELATYRDLETVLSTEDAYNLVELLNVRAVRDYHMRKAESQ